MEILTSHMLSSHTACQVGKKTYSRRNIYLPEVDGGHTTSSFTSARSSRLCETPTRGGEDGSVKIQISEPHVTLRIDRRYILRLAPIPFSLTLNCGLPRRPR